MHLKSHRAADACWKPESKTTNRRTSPGSLLHSLGMQLVLPARRALLARRRKANRYLRHHPAPTGPHHLRQICESLRGNILLLSCLLSRWKGNRSHKPWKINSSRTSISAEPQRFRPRPHGEFHVVPAVFWRFCRGRQQDKNDPWCEDFVLTLCSSCAAPPLFIHKKLFFLIHFSSRV